MREDFGEFPPLPLRCEGLPGNFDVIRTRGIGEVWQATKMYSELLHPAGPKMQELSPDALAFLGDAIVSFQETLESLSGGSQTKRRILTSVALGLLFIFGSFRYARHGPRKSAALGFFSPMHIDESEIVIQMSRHKRSKLDDAATISHEHIHLLQHKHANFHSKTVKSLEVLLTDEAFTGNQTSLKFLLYVLEKNEMEARLHELVLSFYRAHQHLPVTVPAFLAMLAANKQLGWMVKGYLDVMKVPLEDLYTEYGERESLFVVQIESAHMSMRGEMIVRYITEVLPVMYGNLLKFYGDEAASRSLHAELPRPNLFDDLYAI